jgi:two-component system nitrogen regulation sensor histidine kinase GlnL
MNVHEALEHVRQLVTPELPEHTYFVRGYDPSIPPLLADREQLIQVMLNLVGNAVQAQESGGSIRLRTRTQRLFTIGRAQHRLVARIDVMDTGPGIAADLLPNIFHPMVTSRAEGTGMGLPIAQYLVHLHGGLIECESEPGATVFSVFNRHPVSRSLGVMVPVKKAVTFPVLSFSLCICTGKSALKLS